MMGLAPGRGSGAAGEGAAAVTGRERAALGAVGQAAGAAGAQDRAVPVEHGGEQFALVGQPHRGGHGDGGAGLGGRDPGTVFEVLGAEGERDRDRGAAGVGQGAGVQDPAAEVEHRVVAALPGGAVIGHAVDGGLGCGQCVDHRAPDRGELIGRAPADAPMAVAVLGPAVVAAAS